MTKRCIFAGATILGYAGWYVGMLLLGLEFFGCCVCSSIGSMVGVWAGWKVAQRLG
ncbi:MAG TPA: hypothetical protein VIM71_06120 [Lacunisphaera sp.]